MSGSETPQEIVGRCQVVMAHAWMVRTFVKHSEEAEEFPELMGIARVVFDTSRALEAKLEEPPTYLRMLRKKVGKLKGATEQFRRDAERSSTHTNFRQAVISMEGVIADLETLLAAGEMALQRT